MRFLAAILLLLVGACGSQPEAMVPPTIVAQAPAPTGGLKAVLVGAEGSINAFDNATRRFLEDLSALVPPDALHAVRYAERRIPETERSDLPGILRGIASMRAGPNDHCLIYVTGHGGQGRGVYISRSDDFLKPNALDQAITQGCGDRPTVVIISACFSGLFAKSSVARDNRIVLTAARRDRPSFGCGVDDKYTYFDGCFLTAFENANLDTWEEVARSAIACVAKRERAEDFDPSEPQLFVGNGVRGLRRPGARGT